MARKDFDLLGSKITNLKDGTNPQDGITKKQLDDKGLPAQLDKHLKYDVDGAFSLHSLDKANISKGTSVTLNKHTISFLIDGLDYVGIHPHTTDTGKFQLSSFIQMNLYGNKIVNLGEPTGPTDAVNKKYADDKIKANTDKVQKLDSSGDFKQSLSMNNYKITNVATPTSISDVVNKSYNDTYSFRKQNYNANGSKIQNVGTPTSNSHAANKGYVDSKVSGSGILGMQVFGSSSETTLFRKGVRIVSSSNPGSTMYLDSSFVSWANNSANKGKWIIEASINATREENIDQSSSMYLYSSGSGNLIYSSGASSSYFFKKSSGGGYREIKTVGGTVYITSKTSSTNVATNDYIQISGDDDIYSLSLKLIKIG